MGNAVRFMRSRIQRFLLLSQLADARQKASVKPLIHSEKVAHSERYRKRGAQYEKAHGIAPIAVSELRIEFIKVGGGAQIDGKIEQGNSGVVYTETKKGAR